MNLKQMDKNELNIIMSLLNTNSFVKSINLFESDSCNYACITLNILDINNDYLKLFISKSFNNDYIIYDTDTMSELRKCLQERLFYNKSLEFLSNANHLDEDINNICQIMYILNNIIIKMSL